MRRSWCASVVFAAIAPTLGAIVSLPAMAGGDASVAWLRDGRVEVRSLEGRGPSEVRADTRVPLGSLWKLFVFAHLASTQAQEPVYQCTGKPGADEEEKYCCTAGEGVGRNAALAKSCAPYFSPARLGLQKVAWQSQWSRTKASWLRDPASLTPGTEVPLRELLDALASVSPEARREAREALLETALTGYGRDAWPHLGTGTRYKTWSWHRADGTAYGGAAGWLADGTPFWFGATGSSRTALAQWSPRMASVLPAPRWREVLASESSCVDVDFFTRYELKAVWREKESVEAGPGELHGKYRLQFANGNWLTVASRGELVLSRQGDAPQVRARLGLNEYVARVIDREGGARPEAAARALAVAARSYLLQNGRQEGGCWRIGDSTRTQRVSPNPPTEGALAAAWFTDGLVVKGSPVQYHHDLAGPDRMAWTGAVAQSQRGWDFERILADAYPRGALATLSGREECARLEAAEKWLAQASRTWKARLEREPGFEALAAAPRVCALAEGHPYADQKRLRLHVRGWRTLDERVTLAHEYLHLAFRYHPSGADEAYVERLARQLVDARH